MAAHFTGWTPWLFIIGIFPEDVTRTRLRIHRQGHSQTGQKEKIACTLNKSKVFERPFICFHGLLLRLFVEDMFKGIVGPKP
jgi:hypothetical protein